MDIQTLLTHAESKTLEFKKDLSSMDPILKTLVAFANTSGGTLILGRASDGSVPGIGDIFKAEERIANAISDSISPPLMPEIEITTYENKNLLIVKVPHWRGPFYLKKLGFPGGVYIRLGSTSRPAGPELLAELSRSTENRSFDETILLHLSKHALDIDLALQYFKKAGKEINEEKLRTLGVLAQAQHELVPSIGGLILFGKKESRLEEIPDARVSCARFLGDDKTEILDRLDIEGTILDAAQEVPKFISRNTRLASEIKDIRRKDIPEYPPVAIREALINALAHSDYSIKGSRIQIAIFSNRLEIQNPGMLPFGFTLEDLKSGVSRVRNRVIARVFSSLGIMEEWGSGYKRMIEACKQGGYREPTWEEFGSSIRVTFFPHPKTMPHEEKKLKDRQKEILNLFDEGATLSFGEIYEKLPINISERTLRYDLSELKHQGFLDFSGKGRGIIWQRL